MGWREYRGKPGVKERIKEKAKEWRDKNREQNKAYLKKRREELLLAAVSAYGGSCSCCGETRLPFLTVDHVNEDGKEHRKSMASSIYYWLAEHNYPQDGRFQVLCYNCNMAKSFYGACPHSGPVPNVSLSRRKRAGW